MQTTVYIIWCLGAILAAFVLLFGIVIFVGFVLRTWRRGLGSLHLHLWVWQALRAYEKTGRHRPDGGATMDARRKLTSATAALVDAAREEGYVVTIETVPIGPLAMGSYCMQYDVREAQSRYKKPATP